MTEHELEQKGIREKAWEINEIKKIEQELDDQENDEDIFEEVLEVDERESCQIATVELPEGIRLDVGLAKALNKSRTFIQNLIAEEQVWVNGKAKKANYKVREGDEIRVQIPEPRPAVIEGEDIPLDIVYEDDDLLVVNKPQGMVVHPAPGAWTGTLVNALLYHYKNNLSGINGVLRPGIVHRIDKDTSGLLVVAKNDFAHQGLAAQIKEHSMSRRYLAIVHGVVYEPSGTIDAPIGRDPSDRKKMAVTFRNSKPAVTHYRVLKRSADYTFLEATLETGRTHQIRVHMAYLKHPVLGDPLYAGRRPSLGLPGQMLHAAHLGFKHPRTGEWMEFEAEVPELFQKVLKELHLT